MMKRKDEVAHFFMLIRSHGLRFRVSKFALMPSHQYVQKTYFQLCVGCMLFPPPPPSFLNGFSYHVLIFALLNPDAKSAVWVLYLFGSYDSGISFCKLGKLFHISSYIVSGFGGLFPFIEALLKLLSLGIVNYSVICHKSIVCVCLMRVS